MTKVLPYGLIGGLLLGGASVYFFDDSAMPSRNPAHAVGQTSFPETVVTQESKTITEDSLDRVKSEQTASLFSSNNNAVHEDYNVENIDISNMVFDENVSDQILRHLIKASISASEGQSVDMLLNALVSLSMQYGYSERSQLIVDMLAEANSVDAAKKISNYLVNTSNVSPELENAMIGVVNAVANREEVAAYIEEQFISSADNNVREKLLAINYPESLEKIANFALMQGDGETYSKIIDQLDSDPYEHTFNVLLSMNNDQNISYLADQSSVMEAAQQWAYHQLSGSRLDFVEEQLAQGLVSENDKSLVLEMLKHSEDQVRGQAIIAKYWNSKMM